MRTIKQSLDKVKEFLESKIEKTDYKLPIKKENMESDNTSLVHPVVAYGNLPHENFSMYGAEQRSFQPPYILIGIEECTFDYNSETIPILIQVCCYTAEAYQSGENEMMIPDNMGTLDAIGLLESIREWIMEEARFPWEKPFTLGTYDTKESTYPLAFGYIKFDMTVNEGRVNREKFLY